MIHEPRSTRFKVLTIHLVYAWLFRCRNETGHTHVNKPAKPNHAMQNPHLIVRTVESGKHHPVS